MGRPREFNLEQATEDAMHVFWENGYVGSSLSDLLDGTGLARGSLYKAFGSKKQLYLRALKRYDEEVLQSGINHLEKSTADDGPYRIRGIFEGALEDEDAIDRRGCLLCNAAAGPAFEDADIAEAVNAMLGRLTDGFAYALGAGTDLNDAQVSSLKSKAKALTLSYVGLRVMIRSGTELDLLRSAIQYNLSVLDI